MYTAPGGRCSPVLGELLIFDERGFFLGSRLVSQEGPDGE
jgi:hypothetical protein